MKVLPHSDDPAEDRASDRGIVECRAGELRTGVDSFYFSILESRGFFPRGARITALHLLEWSLPRGLEVDKWLRSASSFKKWGWGVAKIHLHPSSPIPFQLLQHSTAFFKILD